MGLTVRVPGSCGELVQGIIDGVRLHVSCPVDRYARATWRPGSRRAGQGEKVRRALAAAGASPAFLAGLTMASELPRGIGMASSTADIGAAVGLWLAMGRGTADAATVARAALAVEPTDGVLFGGVVLFDHRRGTVLERWGSPPPIELVAVEAGGPFPLGGHELPGGGLEPRDTEALCPGLDRHHEGSLGGVEGRRLELRAGGDDAHHLALDDTLRRPRVLHLLAQGDPEALADEPPDVGGGRVPGDPAHGHGVPVPIPGPRGEGDLEGLRRHHGVLEEELVEVPHPEEEEGVRVLRLHALVLLHGRRLEQGGRRHVGRWSIS